MEALAYYPLPGFMLARDNYSRADVLDYDDTCRQFRRPSLVGYQEGDYVKVDFFLWHSKSSLNAQGKNALRDLLQQALIRSRDIFVGTYYIGAIIPRDKWPYVPEKLLAIWQDPDNRVKQEEDHG